MNQSSEESQVQQIKTRPKQKAQKPYLDQLDRARLDPVIPESILSGRSSKRVRFDNKDWNQKLKRDSDSTQENIKQDRHYTHQMSNQLYNPNQICQHEFSSRRSGRKTLQNVPPSRNSSDESQKNYQISEQFQDSQQKFYSTSKSQLNPRQSSRKQAFEPEFLTTKQQLSWQAKATKEGFIYFFIPGTNTFQWQFPTYFDSKTQKKKACFIENWQQKTDEGGHTYYVNKITKFSQEVKPDSETYIIQASMLGNIAFVELYLSIQGDLSIEDQRGRNALHQSVANGHIQLAQMLCEFGKIDNLIERTDKYGCTPLFSAIRYNQSKCVLLLLEYNCNIFHRNKKGDTCLHYAALYNADECLVAIGQFCSEQLIKTKNKEGLRAVDIAEQFKNFKCKNTLHLLERNLVYQSAIQLRDSGLTLNSGRKVPKDSFGNSVTSNFTEPLRNPNVKKFADEPSSYDEEAADASQNLQYQSHYSKMYTDREKTQKSQRHEQEYKIKTKKDQQSERLSSQRVPRFIRQIEPQPNARKSFYDSNIQESYFDEELDGRVSRSVRNRMRDDKYDVYRRNDEPTVFEKAYFGLTKVGSFFKTKVSNIVDYVYSDVNRPRSSRSRTNRAGDFKSDLPLYSARSSSRGRNKRQHYSSDSFGSAREELESSKQEQIAPNRFEDSSGSENYKTTYDRSQSRPATAKSRSRQRVEFNDQIIQPPKSARVHSPPRRERSVQRENHQVDAKQTRPPSAMRQNKPVSVVAKQLDVSEEKSVEMRSICIQAMPPKRVKKKRKVDVSKHSIGVGSMRIDETTMPLQEQSQTNIEADTSQSKVMQVKAKKQKLIKLGNQNKNLIQKRYQSEEEDLKRLEESKNYSPSPQPKYMKPEVIVMRKVEKLGQAFNKEPLQIQPLLQRHPLPTLNSKEQQAKENFSNIRAPNLLTTEQKDILNLHGQVESNPNSGYRLESEILHVQPPLIQQQSFGQITSKAVDEKIKDFYARLASEVSDQSIENLPVRHQSNQLEPIKFNPEEQDEENYQFHVENYNHYQQSFSDSALDELEKENLDNLSDPSFVPNNNMFKFGHQSAASVDRGHILQSTSTHSIANFANQNNSVLKPLKILTAYPQSDCEGPSRPKKIVVPLPKKRELVIKHVDLFSEEAEKQRLKNLSQSYSEMGSMKSKRAEEDPVFFGPKSPKSSENDEKEGQVQEQEPKIQVPKLALTSQDKSNSNKVGSNRYEKSIVEDEVINFDITQEVSQQIHIDIEVARNTTTMVEVIENSIIEQPKEELKIQKAVLHYSGQGVAENDLKQQTQEEIDNISILFDQLKEESTIIGRHELPNLEKLESHDILRELVQRPIGYASSGAEEESKQNRSTAIHFKQNNFLSSDDEMKVDSAKRQKKALKQGNVSTIGTPGGLSNRQKQRKSVKEIASKRQSLAIDQSQISDKTTQSVADRLKQNMAQFKSNKLSSDNKNKSTISSNSKNKEPKIADKIAETVDSIQKQSKIGSGVSKNQV